MAAQAVLFVVSGELELALDGADAGAAAGTHALQAGGYAYIPAGSSWRVRNRSASGENATFHWVRAALCVFGLGFVFC